MVDIQGYTPNSKVDLELINKVKALENEVGGLVRKLRIGEADKRWIAIGVTDLQTGFMALVRSIAKPNSELK